MSSRMGHAFFACGETGLPDEIVYASRTYRRRTTFKRDFFAATGLYQLDAHDGDSDDIPQKVILKIGRSTSFYGFPLRWLGAFLRNHEVEILKKLTPLGQAPHFLGTYGDTGFLYTYIEGRSLAETRHAEPTFFEQLKELLAKVHQTRTLYLDMNKRGNILVRSDGLPCLIDFQISLTIPGRILGSKRLADWILAQGITADRYHLLKHKRRFCPEQLTDQEREMLETGQKLVRFHRCIANPYRRIRRAILRVLYSQGILFRQKDVQYNSETDPAHLFKS